MEEVDLISAIQSHLSSNLNVPILTDAGDDRPVPAVIIDDWNTDNEHFHNSAYSGEQRKTSSQQYIRYLTFDFKTRVEFLIRDNGSVNVTKLKDKLKHQVRLISEYPQEFDTDVKNCILGEDGNPSSQFVEPEENELMLSATFHCDHTVELTDGDTIEEVKENLSFN